MNTAANAATQETEEEISARLAQEAIDAGEIFDGQQEDEAAAALAATANAGQEPGKASDIDPETLAAIAGEEKPRMVPHARFNEVNADAKAQRARVQELELALARMEGKAEGALPPKKEDQAKAFDYDDAEEQYSAAILDGDTSKAREIRGQIRARERADAVAEAEAAADRRYAANREKDDLARATTERDLAIAKAYVDYPFLNAESAEADPDAIEEVLALTNLYTSKGKSIGDALSAAAAKIGPRYAPELQQVKAAQVPKPDIAKGLERDSKIPAKAGGLGARASAFDVSKMTSKDLKGLSAEDEARLAGDII